MIKIIKKIINFFISKTDWRIKKIYRNKSYTNTKPRIELLTAMSKAKGIIHMGAHRGTEAAIYNWLNKKTIWFEANPKIINDLRDNVLQFTNQKVIHSVLSDKDDEIIDFNISSNDGASSSLFLFVVSISRKSPDLQKDTGMYQRQVHPKPQAMIHGRTHY